MSRLVIALALSLTALNSSSLLAQTSAQTAPTSTGKLNANNDKKNSKPEEVASPTPVTVVMDGEIIEAQKIGDDDTLQLQARPVLDFYATNWDLKDELLTVNRKGDGVVLVLNLRTGELKHQNMLLGTLPKTTIPTGGLYLPLGALEALTGTNAKSTGGKVVFELDARLKTVTGFNLFINGKAVVANEVKAIGNTLLIPIDVVVQSLGQRLSWDTSKAIIENFRVQDSATIQLQLSSGLVTINGRPQGIAPGVFQADPNRRLLPANIIETLTGTNIRAEARTGNIYIDIDPRISGTIAPSRLIGQELKNTPFTIQGLDYQINNVGKSRTDIRGYWQSYNGLLSYETIDKPWENKGIYPSYLTLNWQNSNGNSGAFGDANLNKRELSGVDIARVRGVSTFLPYENYAIGLGAGTLQQGNNSNGMPQFSGGAMGFRYYPKGESWEAGASFLDDPLTKRKWVVGSWQKQASPTPGDKDPFSWNLQTDAGFLSNGANQTERPDIRTFGNINKQYKNWFLNADGRYIGSTFRNYSKNSLDILPQDEMGGSVSIQAPEALGVTVSLKMAYTLNGVKYGESDSKTLITQQISLSGRHFGGTWNATYAEGTTKFANENSLQAQGIAPKDRQVYLTWQTESRGISYYLRHERDLIKSKKNTSGNISIPAWAWQLPQNATITANVGASGFANEAGTQFKATGNLLFNSGNLLGPRWLINTGLGANTTLANNTTQSTLTNNSPSSANGTINTNRNGISSGLLSGVYAFFKSTYRLDKRFEWIFTGQSDFKGNTTFFTGISGSLDFAMPRPVSTYLPNRGILKGRVYFDKNYNNQIDPDEEGINGALVMLSGTPYKLLSDSRGYFTITNLLPGIYDVQISTENLPLDFSVSDSFSRRATVGPEEITEIFIPIQRLGIIRGQVWLDSNNNNKIDPEEERIEGANITLYKDDKQITKSNSAFAGQYSFGSLQPGKYRLESIYLSGKAECSVTLDEKNMQQICQLALKK